MTTLRLAALTLLTVLPLGTGVSQDTIHALAPGPKTGLHALVYGPNHAYYIDAPPGWVVDLEQGRVNGIGVALHRERELWNTAEAVMYANAWTKDSTTPTLQAVIAADEANVRSQSPGVKIVRSAPLQTQDRKQATVDHFLGGTGRNYEAIAYIDETKVVALLVLNARSEAGFRAALPVFTRVVGSYFWRTSDVRIDPSLRPVAPNKRLKLTGAHQ